MLVILAAEAAAAGSTVAEIVAMLHERVSRTHVFGMIVDLDALRRSGRVSWAEFGLGTLLQIKPVMMIHQGEISVVGKIRTQNRATKRMLKVVGDLGVCERIAIIHVNAPEAAHQLSKQASHLLPNDETSIIMNITPAIGTHLGLGAIGFACVAQKIS